MLDLLEAWEPAHAAQAEWWSDMPGHLLSATQKELPVPALARVAGWLDPLLDRLLSGDVVDESRDAQWRELMALAVRTVHVPVLARATAALATGAASPPGWPDMLAQGVACLSAFPRGLALDALLDQACQRAPRLPVLLLERAKLAAAQGASAATLEAMLVDLDESHPSARGAVLWLANTLFQDGAADAAVRHYRRADALGALDAANALRLQHLQVRHGAVATPEAPPSPEALEAYAAPLMLLQRLIDVEPTHDSALTPSDLRAGAHASLREWAAAWPTVRREPIGKTMDLQRQLLRIAQARYQDNARWIDAFPFPMGPAYGRYDNERCQVMWAALLRHAAEVGEFGLRRQDALADAARPMGLRWWLEVLRLSCDTWCRLGEVARAQALLDDMAALLGPHMGRSVVQALRELVRLHQDVPDGSPQTTDAWWLRQREWPAWSGATGARAQALVADAATAGCFESVAPGGALSIQSHAVPAVDLALLPLRDARVCLSHGLVDARAGLLRPHAWHRMMGDYPYAHPQVLATSPTAALLVPAADRRSLHEPVVVLANMDALKHRNYYHWTLFLLARAAWLHDHGHLQGRRLLVPQEMSSWMFSGLADAGVPAEALLTYTRDECLQLDDALVVSPIEFASPTLLAHLRQRLWRAAGLDPAAPPAQDLMLYVSRRGENRRPLVEEDALSAMAEAMGFQVVDPGAMPLLEQVRLFARARAIVSPPGAALTNLNWCSPGVRLLVVFKEEAAPPFFVDLAILRGLHYRWLMGRNLPAWRMSHVVNAPFSVDLDLARVHLGWAAGLV